MKYNIVCNTARGIYCLLYVFRPTDTIENTIASFEKATELVSV